MRRKRRYLSTRRVGYLKTGPKLDANQLYQLLPTYFRTHLIIPRANGTGMTLCVCFSFLLRIRNIHLTGRISLIGKPMMKPWLSASSTAKGAKNQDG